MILAAVDASEAAHEIARAAAGLAHRVTGAQLHLVHVAEDQPAPAVVAPVPVGLGISATEVFAAGSAWKQILRIAADLEADLIVIGTRGRGGVKRERESRHAG